MRLIAYVRVSTDDQAREGHSLNQQQDRLQTYCRLHGHDLVAVLVDEGVSAGKPLGSRPAGAELLRRLRAGDAEGLVVIHLDRLFRRASDGLAFLEREVDKRDVVLHVVDQSVDTSSPGGWLAAAMQLVAAEYDRRMDIHRATSCNTALRAAGRVYGGVPYGCVERAGPEYCDRDGRMKRDRVLVRNRAQWAIRERIVHNLRNGMSLRIQQAALADAGIRSPTGKAKWALNTLWGLPTHHDELARLPRESEFAARAAAAHEERSSSVERLN